MFLSATEIQGLIASDELLIEPFAATHLKPASYILRLSNQWRTWLPTDEPLDLAARVDAERLLSPISTSEVFVLSSGGFCLAATAERLSIPSYLVGIVAPLSHLARWGLSVNLGSFIVSPSFGATSPTRLTLEIAAHNPSSLRLRAGLPICHLGFMRVTPERTLRTLTHSVYEGREAPSGPLLYEEWNTNQQPEG